MPKKRLESVSVGQRINEMRNKRKLDLDALAKKTGYDAKFIQEIEEGKVAPPVGALIQISKALEMESTALLAENKQKERRKSYRKRTKTYSYKSLNPGSWDKHLWAYLVTLAPKKEHEKVEYKHDGEEFVHVLEGRVDLKVGKETHQLKKGGSFHFDSAKPHQLKNLSSKESKLLVVVFTP